MKRIVAVGLVAACLLAQAGARAEDPWADSVLQFAQGPGAPAGFSDAQRAVGPPRGGTVAAPNNGASVSLGGQNGRLVLAFLTPVTDDPANPLGLDCIVFSNAFWVGGNPLLKFQEPALIEIAEDVNANGLADDPWYLIPGSRMFGLDPFPWRGEPDGQTNSPAQPNVMAGHIQNPYLFDAEPANDQSEYNWGYAEMTPAVQPYLDNFVRPDNPLATGLSPGSGGGDAFDMAWAADAQGNPANLSRFHFLRLTSFIARNYGVVGVASPEIDAVADVAPDIDADADGILDEYETRVAGTDPARPENTVLPLEIPPHAGGSPPGTLLGTAAHASGTLLRLYAAGTRTDGNRAFNCTVDLLPVAAPNAAIPEPGFLRSGCAFEARSDVADFTASGIQAAEVVLRYQSGDIAGLDEEQLQPYVYRDGAYTAQGIESVQVNAAANQVKFRAASPGLFVLAGPPGAGDTGSAEGPQGEIVLTATPPEGVAAGPGHSVQIASGVILDHTSQPVADGTLVTVASSRGLVTTTDVEGNLPGVQVATLSGVATFTVDAPQQAGAAIFSAASVAGAAYGELLYAFHPGAPGQGPVWRLQEPHGEAPVTFEMDSEPVRDQFGNIVRDGVLLTLEITGDAAFVSMDAEPEQPGFQVRVSGGTLNITVECPFPDSEFILAMYAAPGGAWLGEDMHSPADYVRLPLGCPWPLWASLLAAGLWARRRQVRRAARS